MEIVNCVLGVQNYHSFPDVIAEGNQAGKGTASQKASK